MYRVRCQVYTRYLTLYPCGKVDYLEKPGEYKAAVREFLRRVEGRL